MRWNSSQKIKGRSLSNIDAPAIPRQSSRVDSEAPVASASCRPSSGLMSLLDMTVAIAGSPVLRPSQYSSSSTANDNYCFPKDSQEEKVESLTDIQSF